jgi:hypothetical protein
MTLRSRKCPRCGGTGVPILYGYPSSQSFRLHDEGLIAFGGCLVVESQPTWWCERDQLGWEGPDPARVIRQLLTLGDLARISPS